MRLTSSRPVRIPRFITRSYDALDVEIFKAELKLEADERLKLFEIAAKTRMDEIQLFLSRSNYFMVLQTALAIAVFSGKIMIPAIVFTLALFGFVASFLWMNAGLCSKYWQSRWEQKTSELESKLFADSYSMFNATQAAVSASVQTSLDWHETQHGWLRKRHNAMILWKPSVTFAMFMLSLAFGFAWAVVVAHTFSISPEVCATYNAQTPSLFCFTKITKE